MVLDWRAIYMESEQKQQKQKDWQSLASILRSMSDAVIATDKTGIVTFTNHQADSLTGWHHEEALGQPVRSVFKLLDSEKKTPVKVPTPRSFQKRRKQRDLSHYILLSRDEKQTIIDAILTPILGYRGSITGSVLIFRDVSRKILDAQRDLNAQKVAAIGSVAESIARDFSNRFGIISGHASSIVDNLIPKTGAHEEALKILETSDHAGALLKRLRSLAIAGNIESDIKTEQVDLGQVVENAVRLVKGTFPERNISFNVRNPDSMPYIMADDRQLIDCLVNLFLNAVDAMPDGGTITVDVMEKTDVTGKFVVLRVRDTGYGISRDNVDRIFEPFFTTKGKSAIGLGLTMVQSSLQRWKGFVKVRSRLGQGTSFRLFMRKSKARASKERRKSAHAGGETILLVDDKKDMLEETRDMLQEAGYKVHTAKDGEKGVSLFRKHADEINLSIIDVVMPGKDGKNVLSDILKINPSASIIMISGFSREYVKSYLQRGVSGFLQKPLDRDMLLSSVRHTLDRVQDSITGSDRL